MAKLAPPEPLRVFPQGTTAFAAGRPLLAVLRWGQRGFCAVNLPLSIIDQESIESLQA